MFGSDARAIVGHAEAGIGRIVAAVQVDGDVATTAYLDINIVDDIPSAANNGNLTSVAEHSSGVDIGTVTGLLLNDSYGADGAAG